jgi:hypothetical protein
MCAFSVMMFVPNTLVSKKVRAQVPLITFGEGSTLMMVVRTCAMCV